MGVSRSMSSEDQQSQFAKQREGFRWRRCPKPHSSAWSGKNSSGAGVTSEGDVVWRQDTPLNYQQKPAKMPTMLSKSFILSFVGSLLVTFTVWAGTSALEGVVK